jgi:hypothetical protein
MVAMMISGKSRMIFPEISEAMVSKLGNEIESPKPGFCLG